MIAGPSNPLRVDLKPYPAMKDSGVPWLGEMPEHWDAKRLSQMGKLSKGNGGTKEDAVAAGVACVRYGDLYTTHTCFIRYSRSCITLERARDYTPIKYGDVLFAASGETIEEIGKSAVNLIQSEACCGGDVILFRPNIRVEARFMGYATDCRPVAIQKAIMGRGTTVKHIYGDQLKYLSVPLPPLAEQSAIVRFLDHADRRIRRYIRVKQQLIKLLEEQKQAIIHRAVTRGLEPDARFKPSGVHWLGDIPSHWTVASLRFRYDQCLGKMVDAKSATGKHLVPYLRNVDVRWDSINTQDLPLIDIAPQERERFTLEVGDLLACEGRHLGRCAFWSGEIAVCGFQKALHRLRPLDSATDNPRFLFYCLYLAHTRDAFAASSTDKSIPHLTGEMLRAHRFPFPPVDEQAGICSYLDKTVTTVKRAIATIQAEVTLVHEYRTRLIADVVTGKLDVREAAARLPDEAAEPESVDDVDAVTDAEEGAADDLEAVPDGADA